MFITGASRGIGHATAMYFVNQGWRVVHLLARPGAAGMRRAATATPTSPPICRRSSSSSSRSTACSQLLGDRPLHALVNNAGFSPKGEAGASGSAAWTAISRVWQEVFAINLFSPVFFSRALARRLQGGEGAIVNITSIAGHRVHPFAGSAYSTSKAALWALTRELAADLAPLGIRVNAVCPGEINTAILSPGTDQLVSRIPLKRLGSPTEVAALVYYLCGPEASYVTGAEIPVNGGQDVY